MWSLLFLRIFRILFVNFFIFLFVVRKFVVLLIIDLWIELMFVEMIGICVDKVLRIEIGFVLIFDVKVK